MPSVVPLLLSALPKVSDEGEITTMAQILKLHKKKFTAERCTTLFSKMDKLLQKKDEAYKVYNTVLRIVAPEYYYKTLLKKVQLCKGKKKYKEAERYADFLTRGLFFTDEVKYELSIIRVKESTKNVSLLHRNNDRGLQLIEFLNKSSDIAILKRLKTEKVLGSDDLFYIGFHFSEKLFELKDFGVAVLKYVIKKYPRAKQSSKAKKKLQQVGK